MELAGPLVHRDHRIRDPAHDAATERKRASIGPGAPAIARESPAHRAPGYADLAVVPRREHVSTTGRDRDLRLGRAQIAVRAAIVHAVIEGGRERSSAR